MKTRKMRNSSVKFRLSLCGDCQGGRPACFTAQKRLGCWRGRCLLSLWRQGIEVKQETKGLMISLRDQTGASLSSLYKPVSAPSPRKTCGWTSGEVAPGYLWRSRSLEVRSMVTWRAESGRGKRSLTGIKRTKQRLPYRQWELQASSPTRHTRRVTSSLVCPGRRLKVLFWGNKQLNSRKIMSTGISIEGGESSHCTRFSSPPHT